MEATGEMALAGQIMLDTGEYVSAWSNSALNGLSLAGDVVFHVKNYSASQITLQLWLVKLCSSTLEYFDWSESLIFFKDIFVCPYFPPRFSFVFYGHLRL